MSENFVGGVAKSEVETFLPTGEAVMPKRFLFKAFTLSLTREAEYKEGFTRGFTGLHFF